MKKQDSSPPERTKTQRMRLVEALKLGPATVSELSKLAGLSERQVLDNLEHIRKSAAGGRKLAVAPAVCLECGFTFAKRDRLSRPGRCPACRSNRISHPRFHLS